MLQENALGVPCLAALRLQPNAGSLQLVSRPLARVRAAAVTGFPSQLRRGPGGGAGGGAELTHGAALGCLALALGARRCQRQASRTVCYSSRGIKGKSWHYDRDELAQRERKRTQKRIRAMLKRGAMPKPSDKRPKFEYDDHWGQQEAVVEEEDDRPAWQPADPVEVRFEDVCWTPVIEGALDNGRNAAKDVLKEVNWAVAGKEKVGLIGPNGAGKSAMLAMLVGNLESTSGNISRRPKKPTIAYLKQEADLKSDRTARAELLTVLGARTLEAIDADIARVCGSEETVDELDTYMAEREEVDEIYKDIETLIEQLELGEFLDTPVCDLSGGYQMRVALGKLMVSQPDMLLLDEPTNHIDMETVEFMEKLLKIRKEPMVIVSHDRYFLNKVCDKIVHLEHGKTRQYRGNYLDFQKARDRYMLFQWRTWALQQDRIRETVKKLRKRESRFEMQRAAEVRKTLDELVENQMDKPEVLNFRDFTFPVAEDLYDCPTELVKASSSTAHDAEVVGGDGSDDADSEDLEEDPELKMPERAEKAEVQVDKPPLLEVTNLSVSFGDKAVLKDVSLSLRPGEKVALVGRNGCGKSTLVRAIVKDLGEDGVSEGSIVTTKAHVAYFPQRQAQIFTSNKIHSVSDALYFTVPPADIDEIGGLPIVLERLRLDGATKDQPVSSLSGGEKARVAFARFFIRPTGLLLLDEPTNHLDIPTRELLEDALKDFKGAALVVSHDRFFLREFATRVVEVQQDGSLVDFDCWDAYEDHASKLWEEAQEAEVVFIKQDAKAKVAWSNKKMSRVKKKEGNVGVRRLSKRADEFVPEVEEERQRRQEEREAIAYKKLVASGVDPAMLSEHAPEKKKKAKPFGR